LSKKHKKDDEYSFTVLYVSQLMVYSGEALEKVVEKLSGCMQTAQTLSCHVYRLGNKYLLFFCYITCIYKVKIIYF